MTKLAIIGGAGGLGSTLAFYLGLKGCFDHISLVASRRNALETHLIDLRECFGEETATTVSGGGYEELEASHLVIMAAAVARRKVSSRDEYLKANLDLVRQAAREIKKRAPGSTVISCVAPVDAYVLVFLKELGSDRRRLLGFCRNDSQRFRHMTAKVTGLDPKRMDGLVLGEHGETQVPLFSSLTYEGQPLPISPEQKTSILALLKGWYRHWQEQNTPRSTTWTSSTSLWRTILDLKLIPPGGGGRQEERENDLPCRPYDKAMGSVFLDGEYGLSGVALGLPLTHGPFGWGEIIELDLWPEEMEGFKKSAAKVISLYESCR